MNAELSRLLAAATSSPYWGKFASNLRSLSDFNGLERNKPIKPVLVRLCIKAYSLDGLARVYQDFLKGCDRSNAVQFYLFRGSKAGKSDQEIIQAVIDQMEAWGILSDGNYVIANRDRFSDVDFLEAPEIRVIGDIGGTPLYLLGKEQGSDAPIVSRGEKYGSVLGFQIFSPVSLYALLSQAEPIKILEPLSVA